MIKLKNIKNQKINQILLLQTLFYTFPLSFILGNLILSAHLLLFLVLSLFVIFQKKLTIRFDKSCWLLIFFFSYLFISTAVQFQIPGLLSEKIQGWPLEYNPIFKSFLLFRFLIFIFVIDTLYYNKILSFKNLFLISLICTTFVCIDVVVQYVTGSDFFGYKSEGNRYSGPFGNELIAGSYLLKFSFFSIFYVFGIVKLKNYKTSILLFTITLHAIAILLAGNRMPVILFLFGCFLIILFVKNMRLIMSLGVSLLVLTFLILSNFDEGLKNNYNALLGDTLVKKIINFENGKTEEKSEWKKGEKRPGYLGSGYRGIYETSYKMWKEQPIIGFGLKSFRIKCWDVLEKKKKGDRCCCSTHPHNYYLEMLDEAGIVGVVLMLLFFAMLIRYSFEYIKKYNQQNFFQIAIMTPVILEFILEIWPLRSSGSFFTTWNASFFWLIVAMLIAAKSKKFISLQ